MSDIEQFSVVIFSVVALAIVFSLWSAQHYPSKYDMACASVAQKLKHEEAEHLSARDIAMGVQTKYFLKNLVNITVFFAIAVAIAFILYRSKSNDESNRIVMLDIDSSRSSMSSSNVLGESSLELSELTDGSW